MTIYQYLILLAALFSVSPVNAQKENDPYRVHRGKIMYRHRVVGYVDHIRFQIHKNQSYITLWDDKKRDLLWWFIQHEGYTLLRPFSDINYDPVMQDFRMIGEYHGRDKDNIFYLMYINEGNPHGPHEYYTRFIRMEEADPATFEFFQTDERYGRDRNHVYYEYKTIEGADPESFEVLTDLPAMTTHRLKLYSGEKVELPDNPGIAKDRNHVYWREHVMGSVDPDDFTLTASDECIIHGKYYRIRNYRDLELIEK